jgi:ubiquinone/menaquinone biosynthesis C-methylase UbiE
VTRPVDLPDAVLVSVVDDVPAWSGPFGAALLDRVELRPGMTVLDVGCGTGYPAIELANRLGQGCRVLAVDVWGAALERARLKAEAQGASGVVPLKAAAERLPFAAACFDLVVSNNGLNNVQDEELSFVELGRVVRPGGQLVITWNLPETMAELYRELEAALVETGLDEALPACAAHIHEKRKPVDHVLALLSRSGFERPDVARSSFMMRFASGRALLGHFLIRLAFRPAWEALVPLPSRGEVFARLEARLDAIARATGEIRLTVPFACVSSRRSR